MPPTLANGISTLCAAGRLCPRSYSATHDVPWAFREVWLVPRTAQLAIASTRGSEQVCAGCLRGSKRVPQIRNNPGD